MLVSCTECEHTFFNPYKKAWLGQRIEAKLINCPACGTVFEIPLDHIRREEDLPPFKVDYGDYGIEVYIGREASDNGQWALRDRDSEEEFRKMLQHAVDIWEKVLGEGGDTKDLAGFRRAVHFLLSHSVNMGWHIHVPEDMIDKLDGVEAQRIELSGSMTSERKRTELEKEMAERALELRAKLDIVVGMDLEEWFDHVGELEEEGVMTSDELRWLRRVHANLMRKIRPTLDNLDQVRWTLDTVRGGESVAEKASS